MQRRPEVGVGGFHGSGAGLSVLPRHARTAEALDWLYDKHGHMHHRAHLSHTCDQHRRSF